METTSRKERLAWRPEQALERARGGERAVAALALCEQASAGGASLADLEMAIVFFSRALDGLDPGPVPAERAARLERDLATETSPALTAWLDALRAPVREAGDLDQAIRFLMQARGIWLAARRIRDQRAEPDEGFPVGAALPDGSLIVEAIRGDDVRGMYRAVDPRGDRLLVTVTSKQKVPHAQLERDLSLPVEGIARLRQVGSLGPEHDALVEEEPHGRPSTDLALPLWPGDAVALAGELAAVLERAHATGVVLGFLRPELVYLWDADGRPRLGGIAPRADRFVITASAAYGAKPLFDHLFTAPEVLAMQKKITPAADVFSLCAALAVWLTGEHPFEGDSPTAQMGAIAGGRGRPWRGPAGLGMALARGLERDPRARPALAELMRDLRSAADQP